MTRARRWTIFGVLLVLLVAFFVWRRTCSSAGSNIRVTISKDTTYITEPLRKDGYPDYVAALNQRFSEGVTPENNSAVLFWKAVGPRNLGDKSLEQYFKMLGIPPLPESGDYYIGPDAWVSSHKTELKPGENPTPEDARDPLEKQFYDSAMKRPWSKEEFPLWAEWVAANEKPLALVVEASKRPRRYDPLITGEDGTAIAILLPGVQAQRDVARALIARAMLRLHEGRTDEAWADLLACHRMARLAGQGPTLVEGLVGITLDGIAIAGDQTLLQHAKLTTSQIAKMRADLAKLSPMPGMVDRIDVAERFMFLDCASIAARDGPSAMGIMTGVGKPKGAVASLISFISAVAIDWDVVLRMGNEWYDRMAAAGREPTRATRKRAMDSINDDIKKLGSAPGLSMVLNPSRTVSQIFVRLFLPAVSACFVAEDRAAMQSELNSLAFALAAYRVDHGSYTAKLAELAPKYVREVPKDIFNDADLHYRQDGKGYLLYSVGENGLDDGGKGREDAKASESWDDLSVRMPEK